MLKSFIQSVSYPEEIPALASILFAYRKYSKESLAVNELALQEANSIRFCYRVLSRVSRSFSVVIQRLPEEVRDAVCLFYLVLRALDSIEDDTSIPAEQRKTLLREFYLVHYENGWKTDQVGDQEDYRNLLAHYDRVITAFTCLDPEYQHVIISICKEMGEGMAEYIDQDILSVLQYDEYCYYVAGLVGKGLTQLFIASGLESAQLRQDPRLAISMGQFLQKTNIIRDFNEDAEAGRSFWPAEIWRRYTGKLSGLQYAGDTSALYCLNHMVADALRHTPDCMEYLRMLRNPQIFYFCAVPQSMAIATLAEVYSNPLVFQRSVKIRKGLAAWVMKHTTSYEDAIAFFQKQSLQLFEQLSIEDPSSIPLVTNLHLLQRTLQQNQPSLKAQSETVPVPQTA